jgi:plastocyanin
MTPFPTLRGAAWALLSVPLFLTAACGSSDEESASTGARSTRGPSSRVVETVPLPTLEHASEALGALYGEIRFEGEAPERFPIGARKKSECSTHPDVEHLSDIVVVEDGKLASVLVHVTRGYDEEAIPAPPGEPAVLDQRGCIYTPHVLALQTGQLLEVHNSDPTTHNVNARTRKNASPGNRNMGKGQPPLEIEFTRPETAIHFKCDIHPWMESRVHVIEHPWFDVTGTDGVFRIEGLAPGTYTVEALHEEYGKRSAKGLVVEAGKATGFALTFAP